jgi:hypothetical protein
VRERRNVDRASERRLQRLAWPECRPRQGAARKQHFEVASTRTHHHTEREMRSRIDHGFRPIV